MKLEQLRTSSPTHLQFPTQTKSIKLLNCMPVSCKGFSPHQTVLTTKLQAKSYRPRSGFKTITTTSVQQSFTMLEPYQSSRGHRFQIGLKLILDESRLKARALWLGRLPIAHAHTLFIAYRMTKDPAFEALSWMDTLQKAWVAQLTGIPSILQEVDVDKECLEQLEE
jgi:hypothetical protein